MFAEYNYYNFPYVKVKFNKNIENDTDFKNFLLKWIQLYNQKEKFIFIFDTTNVGFVNPKYCFQMALFIRNLKMKKVQYLKKSYIIVNSKIVRNLLELIFIVQKPLAPVYLIKEKEYVIQILKKIIP